MLSSGFSQRQISLIILALLVLQPFILTSFALLAEQSRLRESRSVHLQATTTSIATLLPPELPEFLGPVGNHTVPVGKDVQLECKVNQLGNYRIAWLRVEDKGILTIHNKVITRNYRIGLINNDIEGSNSILTIKNVQASDKVS